MVWQGIQTSGFRDILGRLAGWCPKEPLSQHFRICEAEYVLTDISVHLKLCVPHPTKHKQNAKTITKPSVFAIIWEGIQTLGFQAIPKMPLSLASQVFEAECV